MKYLLLIIIFSTMAGCGKRKASAPKEQATQKNVSSIEKSSHRASQSNRPISLKLSESVVTSEKNPSLLIKGFKADINNVTWSPDSSKIMIGTVGDSDLQGNISPAQVKIWNATTGKELLTIDTPNASRNGVSWSPDGKRLAIKSGATISLTDEQAPGQLQIVDAQNGKAQVSVKADSQFLFREMVRWSPDGRSLSGLIGDEVAIWETATGKREKTLGYADSDKSVLSLTWSPDGSKLAVGCDEALVDIHNIADGKVLKTFKGGFMKIGNQSIKLPSLLVMMNSVEWSPNGKLIAGANDSEVKIWDVNAGTKAGVLNTGTKQLAWSPDGTQLAGSTRKLSTTDSVTIWNVTQNKPGIRFIAHERGVSCLAWSPDGTKLVTCGRERSRGFLNSAFTLKVWSLTEESTQPETKVVSVAGTKKPQPTQNTPNAGAKKNNPYIGKWSEFGATVKGNPEIWEFHDNGTVDIVDEGNKFNFKYIITGKDTITIKTIFGALKATLSQSGDELTSAAGKYRRLK
jgi:WD40 repeat protein